MNFTSRLTRTAAVQVWILASCAAAPIASAAVVEIEGGPFERRNSLVSLMVPPGSQLPSSLQSSDGSHLPLQPETATQGWFLLPRLPAQTKIELRPASASTSQAAGVRALRKERTIEFVEGNRVAFVYQ